MKKTFTSHSEYLPLDTVLLMSAIEAFHDDIKLEAEWKRLNYTGKPDLTLACEEYNGFLNTLTTSGAQLHFIPGDPSLSLDAVYCRDASIMTDGGAILCNMGKEERGGEPSIHRRVYESLGIPILGVIESPGMLEGGDTAWLDRETLAVGHSYRTNTSGIDQVRSLLSPLGVEVIVVPLPHFRGPSDVFHLMSILSPLDRDLAAIYSPLMPIYFRELLLEKGYHLVEIPEAEFDSLGCNILATGARQCVMAEGNPITEAALRRAGCQVTLYKGREISVKGGGGPTCLTRPLRRRL